MSDAPLFSIVPVEVWQDRRLTLEQVRVLGALLSFRGKNTDVVWPGREAISLRCGGMHISNVSAATTALARLGWLTKEGRGGHSLSTRYRITVPDLVAESATVVDSATVAGSATDPLADSATDPLADSATRKEQTNELTTEHTKVTSAGTRPRNTYPEEFELAWQAYPSRPGASKADSLRAWKARVKAGGDPLDILAGVERYAAYCRAAKIEPQYIKQPATFFGPGEHYLATWQVPVASSRPVAGSRHAARDAYHADAAAAGERLNIDTTGGQHGPAERDITGEYSRVG